MTDTIETIFIVDDDPSVLKSLDRLIRSAGWKVEAYASGSEFLARLPFSGRGCVIMDLTMPETTGLEVCDQMAARGSSLPIIFLTGGNPRTLMERGIGGRAMNFVDLLTKPVDAQILLNAIRVALSRAVP